MKECDISKVPVVLDLLAIPDDRRGAAWRKSFYEAVIDASFACGDPQVIGGPDGFPYFGLYSPEPNKPFESYCICNLLELATTEGFGIAVNPRGREVDWVLSYGDLLSMRLYGSFEVTDELPPPAAPDREVPGGGEQILIGQPSEAYLPGYARSVIRKFLEGGVKIQDPRVFMMMRPSARPVQQLVFSIFPEDFDAEDRLRSALAAMGWFLPRHYAAVSIPKSSELTAHFQPL